jgi:UDP-N-acetylmuramyl pentapeptide synthase
VIHKVFRGAWPVTSRLARLYRLTVVARTRVVAVVGSLGKSTTANFVWSVLGCPNRLPSQRNSWSFIAREVLRIRRGDRWAVIEAGISSPGWMSRYAKVIQPDVTVVTSIASEHNRSFGTFEVTRAEKSAMVRALPAHGMAILNGDDEHVLWMAGTTHARVVTYGFKPTNDVVASGYEMDWPRGSKLEIETRGSRRRARLRLIGRHSVYAALAAVAAAVHVEDRPLAEAVSMIEDVLPLPYRMEPVQLQSGAWLIRDEGKSTLETIDTALDALSEIPADRRFVVIGQVSEPVGPQQQLYLRLGARIAGIASGVFIVCGRHNFKAYRSGGRGVAGPTFDPVKATPGLENVIDRLRSELRHGDVVLIKGRDTQRLERISLALAGREVRCRLSFCGTKAIRCEHCPMLERG